jgi:spore germination protein YaaH
LEKRSIFVPYWALTTNVVNADLRSLQNYDRVIYFGVNVGINGLTNDELRMADWVAFTKALSAKEKYLTLIMTNTEANAEILKDPASWQKIADDTVKLIKANNFQGVVLDLEMSTFSFERIVNQIYDFHKLLAQELKKNNIAYATAIYGDNFYRQRPYYVKGIADLGYEIVVMAYDFHKAGGEPGPNMSLGGRETYGYDFKQMVSDFLVSVPPNQLTIVYGMYGYDWQVDDQKKPINQAKSKTLSEIRKEFLEKCDWKDCLVRRDKVSAETEVEYVRSEVVNDFGYLDYHIVWFEDERSVKQKTDYLNSKGIGSVGYWAYSYF